MHSLFQARKKKNEAILYNIPIICQKDVDIKLKCSYVIIKKIMRTVLSLQAGLLSLDSQTAMARIGCVTMVDGGLTNKLPLER